MPKGKVIAGLDLGSSKITTLVAQVQEGFDEPEVSVVGVASTVSKGIKKGQIVNIEETVEAVIASLEGAERMAGYRLDSAYIALGGGSISSENSHGVVAVAGSEGEISSTDIERAIEAASAISLPSTKEIIHVLPREFVVDGEKGVRDPVGMNGVRLEVETHIITASASATKNLKKAVNEIGVRIDGLVYSGLAASTAVLTPTEKELGCCLIDIGGGTTSVIAFIDGAISYSGVIPIGAKNVTNDLAIGLRVSLETAEKIKIAVSGGTKADKSKDEPIGDVIDLSAEGITEIKKVSKKTLVEGIIRPRLNEIFTMVRIELEKAGISSCIPSGVVVTGGGALTVGVEESAKRTLSLPVRVGIPTGVTGLIDDIIHPSYAVAIGLLKYGAKEEGEEPSFSSSIFKKVKLPNKGIFGKIIERVKDLLP